MESDLVSIDRKASALRQAIGPVIAAALATKFVVELIVNPDGKIWIHRIGKRLSLSGKRLAPFDVERSAALLRK